MKYRKLRIVWSVVWGVVAVLLLGLWVRSYHEGDSIERWHNRTRVLVTSVQGQLVALWVDYSPSMPAVFTGSRVHSWNVTNPSPIVYVENSFRMPSLLGLRYGRVSATARSHPFVLIGVPYWFPAFIAIVLGASPWFLRHSHFSLRTLLIATTLVAMVLGLVAWASHK